MRRVLVIICAGALTICAQPVAVQQAPAPPPPPQGTSGGGGGGGSATFGPGAIGSGTRSGPQGAVVPDQEKPPEKPGSISGQITSATGEPVRKAEVVAQRMMMAMRDGPMNMPMMLKATTDESGKFTLSNLEPGQYMVRAQKTGFVVQSYGSKRPGMGAGTALTLAPGQEMTNIFIKLTPQAVITGKVLDADGEPIAQCRVMALQQRYMQGKKQWMPTMGGGATNDVGEYRLAQLAPGKYVLQAAPMRMGFGVETTQAPKDGVEEGYVATYYPSAMDPAEAVPVDVPAGGQLSAIDFKLAKTRVFRVKGKLVDSSGAPMTNVPLQLVRSGDSDSFVMMGMGNAAFPRGRDGAFEITGVTPGSYVLVSPGSMNGEKRKSIYVPVEISTKNVEDLVAVANDGGELTGTVRVDGDDKAVIRMMNVMLQPSSGMGFSFANARVKDDKTFTLAGVMPGKYRVMANGGPENSYVKAVMFGGQDVLASGVDLRGGVGGTLEVVLGGNAGKVTGTVQNEKKPAPGVTVVLVPEASKREMQNLYKYGRTDQNGNFTIAGVPPGEYTALALEDMMDQSYQDPEFLKKYDSNGMSVKLKEGESQNVQLSVIPMASADGN